VGVVVNVTTALSAEIELKDMDVGGNGGSPLVKPKPLAAIPVNEEIMGITQTVFVRQIQYMYFLQS
jgi:hypothetical protein